MCDKCGYKTNRKSDYNKHIKTEKHLKIIKYNGKEDISTIYKWRCLCGKKYKYDSGFYRHKKVCNQAEGVILVVKDDKKNELGPDEQNIHAIVLNLVEENKELKEMIIKQMNQIEEIVPKIGHTTNNTLNLQVFLYEDCKDAINLNDFIDGLNIKIQDLEHTKKYGLCEGVQNIFVNGLKELGTHKRPIHCTDIKRETLYIKDNNNWVKDVETKETLKKSLLTIAYKQRKVIKAWEDENPNWNKSERGKEEWIKIVQAITSSFDEDKLSGEKRMIKNIVREVKIK